MANETDHENEMPSEFEKAVAGMSPDQFDRVTAAVLAEAERRNDPLQRIGSLSNAEARKLIDQKYGFTPF